MGADEAPLGVLAYSVQRPPEPEPATDSEARVGKIPGPEHGPFAALEPAGDSESPGQADRPPYSESVAAAATAIVAAI